MDSSSLTKDHERSSAADIDAFLDHLRLARRLAHNSVESYARDLTALARFASAADRPIVRLAPHDLERFVRDLMASGYSPRSVARTVSAVRGLYKFLVLDRRLASSPAMDLRVPRAWPGLPKFLSPEESPGLESWEPRQRAVRRCSRL
jgi:site-specific recombinase XerD